MTLRRLARGSIIYAAGNLLARLGSFLLLPIYLQFLSREEYGLVSLVTAIVGLLGIVCRVGLDGALMRLHFDTDHKHLAGLYRTLMATTLGISAAVVVLLAAVLGPFFSVIFFGVPFVPYGLLALGITFVGSADYVPSVLYRASQQPERFFLFSLGSFAVASALSLALVFAGLGALGVLLGQFTGGVIVLGLVLFIALRPRGPRWYRDAIRPALLFGLPLVPHQLSTWALRLSDRWLLGLLLAVPTSQRLASIGAYSVGYQLGNLVAMLATSFNLAWTPYFYRMADRARGPTIYREVITLAASLLSWIAVSLSVEADEIITVIAKPGYALSAQVLPIVAVASVCQGMYTMLVGVIFLRRRTAMLPLLTVTSAGVNVLMNIVLIPRIGVLGAAWSTLTAYALFATLTLLVARRMYPLHLDWPRLAAVAGIGFAGWGVSLLIPPASDGVILSGLTNLSIAMACGAGLLAVTWRPFGRLREAVAAVPAGP